MFGEMINREIKAQEYENSLAGYVVREVFWLLEKLAYAAPVGAALAGGCDYGEIEEPDEPVAELTATPDQGPKTLTVLLDASASTSGRPIDYYGFDIDGDGFPDYEETPYNHQDGSFDGKTTVQYPGEGDFEPEVTVMDDHGRTASQTASVKVGFGPDRQGAMQYIDDILTAQGYTCTQDQDFQLFNPTTYGMTAYTGLKAELSDEILYFLYDSSTLTQEQLDTLDARAAEGMNDPVVTTVEPDQSPNTIDDILIALGLI